MILPASDIDAINKEPGFDFDELIAKQFFGDSIHGFQSFRQPPHGLIPKTMRTKVAQSLGRYIGVLSGEMGDVLRETWGEESEWRERQLGPDMQRIISRLSSRVFVGRELGRNDAWLHIAINYAIYGMVASRELRLWPAALRPVVHWVLPNCRALRRTAAQGRALLAPVVEERRARRQAGEKRAREDEDCIDWLDEVADGKIEFDPVLAQLNIALASIHTTSDLVGQALINLCLFPEWVERLRKEAADVVARHGLSKMGMHALHQIDAFLKETHRLKPSTSMIMERLAMKPITLPDGTKIPAGVPVAVSSAHMWSAAIHDAPLRFDPERWLRLRATPGQEFKSHFVSTSADHFTFGHGKHACPGRFFAADEVKIVLVHVLLKYEVELAGEVRPTEYGFEAGPTLMWDPRTSVRVRRRKEEVVV